MLATMTGTSPTERLGTGSGRPGLGYPEVVSAFSEIASAINEETDLDQLLHLVAERICTLLSIRRCSVYLKDRATGVFRGQVAHSDNDIDIAIKRLTVGIEADGFTREILNTQRPVLVVNAQSDPRPVRAAMLQWNVRTMLGVPMILRGDVIGLLFLDNEDQAHDYTPEQQELSLTFANLAAIAISQAQLTADLRSTLGTAAQQNAMLRRAAALEDRLMNLVLEGADLNQIAAAVTELTGKPCSIHDAEYRRLAHSAPAGDAVIPRVLDSVALQDPAVREALAGLTARRPSIIPPIPAAGLHRRGLVALVRVGNADWGYLVLTEYRSRFGAQDAIVARRTATIIALELSGKRRAAEADSHAVEALARDLLHASDDVGSLSRRADYHGLALSEPHHVVLLSMRDQAVQGRISGRRIAEAFAEAAPHLRAFVADVEKDVAIVLERPEAPSANDAVRALKDIVEQVVRRLAPEATVTAGISTVCRGAADYPGAHEQTRQISRGISTFGAPGQLHILAADDLGAGRLLLATADRSEADRFVRDTLGALLDEQDAGIHDLFVTLQAFFECSRSVRRSATSLGVHENTVRYRLSRIEELTGLDIINDGNAQLAVQLALLILRLEDRLAGPDAHPVVTSAKSA
jgi:sugar diacid utilization regulator/GAF domain-containing protein